MIFSKVPELKTQTSWCISQSSDISRQNSMARSDVFHSLRCSKALNLLEHQLKPRVAFSSGYLHHLDQAGCGSE